MGLVLTRTPDLGTYCSFIATEDVETVGTVGILPSGLAKASVAAQRERKNP